MTNGVTFHQRINQQYNSLDEENRRRFDDLIVNLQRGGIFSIPASRRKVLSGRTEGPIHNLWAIRLSPDLRVIVQESEGTLTVREIARKGRIQFYRDLAGQR
jgi:mRNA-degrading endonuclease RelE of RelBE toxin-antitoxin system